MNEITFVLALLVIKKAITNEEALELHKIAVNGTLNHNFQQNLEKVQRALNKATGGKITNVEKLDAKSIF